MRTTAYLLCALLAAGALLPLAQGAHFTLYHDATAREQLGSHAAFATFEGTAPIAKRHNNVNGPPGAEDRAVPSDPNIFPTFHGLTDRLVSDLGMTCTVEATKPCTLNGTAPLKQGGAIFDVHYLGSAVQSGNIVPYNYYASETLGGASRMYPAGHFGAWHGYWWDKMNDATHGDVINDVWTACKMDGGGSDCSMLAADKNGVKDEFVWRGSATGESGLSAVGWFFPRDGSADARTPPYEPMGFAGNCNQWGPDKVAGNANCVSPAPDWTYTDETDPSKTGNEDNQRWFSELGGGRYYYEETLITPIHVVSVIGAASIPGAPEQFDIHCGDGSSHGGRGCFRDYDYFDALAGDSASTLYYDVMRPVRDAVWVPYEEFSINEYIDPNTLYIPSGACPWDPVKYCRPNQLHEYARYGQDADGIQSSGRAWVEIGWQNPTPNYAGTDKAFLAYWCSQALGPAGYDYDSCYAATPPPQGFYGDYPFASLATAPYNSTMRAGSPWMRPLGTAWIWDDLNADGYIGTPRDQRIAYYNQGIESNPNNLCEKGGQTGELKPCEVTSRSDVFATLVARVEPGTSGWPPGTFVMRNYESAYGGRPLNPAADYDWTEFSTPLFERNVVDLRFDQAYCKALTRSCRTIDALFIPQGSVGVGVTATAGTLVGPLNTGTFTDGVAVSWEEGERTVTATFGAPFTQAHAQAFPDHYPPQFV